MDEFDLELDWRGFELHPETPPGGMPLTRLFSPQRLPSMRDYMKSFAAGFGIADMQQPERLPNTRAALAVAEYARDEGRLDAYRRSAMEAHWNEGRDLERADHLSAIAQRAGLDGEAAVRVASDARYLARVDAAREEAHDAGVTGVPTFFFGEMVVVGCQPFDQLARVARLAGAVEKKR
jgi:predicted DsbA family dithiol-disulfide isomerase